MKKQQLFQLKTTSLFNPKDNTPKRRIHQNSTVTKQQATWTEWCTNTINQMYPYFTSEYYYIGQVAAGVAVTCYYAIPYVIKKLYPYKATESVASSTLPTQTPSESTIVTQAAEASILNTQNTNEPAVQIANSLSPIEQERIINQALIYGKSASENLKSFASEALKSFSTEIKKKILEEKLQHLKIDLTNLAKELHYNGEIIRNNAEAVTTIQSIYKKAYNQVYKVEKVELIKIENVDKFLDNLLYLSQYFNQKNYARVEQTFNKIHKLAQIVSKCAKKEDDIISKNMDIKDAETWNRLRQAGKNLIKDINADLDYVYDNPRIMDKIIDTYSELIYRLEINDVYAAEQDIADFQTFIDCMYGALAGCQ